MVLGKGIKSKKKSKEPLLVASKKVSLEINTENTKYMFVCREKNAGQNHNIKTSNKSSGKCGKVKIFGNNTNKSKLHT
jgi:hypothetical protein